MDSNKKPEVVHDELDGAAIGGHVHGPDCHHGHHGHQGHHGSDGRHHVQDTHAPYVRAAPKVGRNDPCTCGSGKKFKKCCGGVQS